MQDEINIFRCLDFLRDNAPVFAQAKANRVYLEEYRKSLKAILMQKSSEKAANAKEIDAYSDPQYLTLIEGLRDAVKEEETLRWQMVSAQEKIEVWRSLESSRRQEAKNV